MSELWLGGSLTTGAYGWRLERRDGVTMGFTSHDRDIEVDGLFLRASPGMIPSSITESLGLEADGLDVRGALSSDAISAADLQAGRWDRARLSLFLFDWTAPNSGKRMLAVGELGAISFSGNGFEAEFKGPAAKLDCVVAPYASPVCRAEFCGADCGLNKARFRHVAKVLTVAGSTITLDAVTASFAYGKLRWLDGRNCGLWSEILDNQGAVMTLTAPPSYDPLVGARVELIEGCDKTLATCAVRFGNAINFRGEPHLPGNDILTRYPGTS